MLRCAVEIISVNNHSGNPKEKRIWGSRRILDKCEIGECMFLTYPQEARTRRTSLVTGIQESFDKSIVQIHTENSIYTLKFLDWAILQ